MKVRNVLPLRAFNTARERNIESDVVMSAVQPDTGSSNSSRSLQNFLGVLRRGSGRTEGT